MERPAFTAAARNIRHGLIDVVVVYKVDRLTRSLADFAKMVEVFDAQGVSFVAVTQQFNTTTSMGRVTLNVLLSFAQFRTRVTGERIRDKIAASKWKGIWMGGCPSMGYDVCDRRLVVNQVEAETVRQILPVLSQNRFGTEAKEVSRPRRHRVEDPRLQEGKQIRRAELFAWRAVRTAVQSDLHRRDSSQAGTPSWTA